MSRQNIWNSRSVIGLAAILIAIVFPACWGVPRDTLMLVYAAIGTALTAFVVHRATKNRNGNGSNLT